MMLQEISFISTKGVCHLFTLSTELYLSIAHLVSADLLCADYKTLMLDFTFGLTYADCFTDVIFLVGAEKKEKEKHSCNSFFFCFFFACMKIGAPVTKTMYDKPQQIKRL